VTAPSGGVLLFPVLRLGSFLAITGFPAIDVLEQRDDQTGGCDHERRDGRDRDTGAFAFASGPRPGSVHRWFGGGAAPAKLRPQIHGPERYTPTVTCIDFY
jgi:hypothetical protein